MIRLALRVREEHAEIVLAELLELAPGGVEEARPSAGTVEFAVYGAPGELPTLPDLRVAAGDALVDVSTSEIADDWDERWRSFHRPVLVRPPRARARAPASEHVPAVGIRPPWLDRDVWEDDAVHDIVIDPAQAFGTGAHATTRGCLELLLALAAHDRARGGALDVGTGSGVLAIAAATLGFDPVVALDNDPQSVRAASANARVNCVELDVRAHDLRTDPLPAAPPSRHAPPRVVLANLLEPLLFELADSLADALAGSPGSRSRAPEHLIAGGLLADQADQVVDRFATRLSMREHERRESAGWVSLWLAADR